MRDIKRSGTILALRRRPATLWLAAVAALLAVAGCGDKEGEPRSAATSPAAQATAARPALPTELVGSYTVRLRHGDLPADAPPELVDGGPEWTLTIRPDGGVDGEPSFTIASANGAFGELETSTPVVAGDQLTLKAEECAAGGTTELLDNVYAYALEGSKLRFTTVSNTCADKVAETILTSRPWTKEQR